MDLLGGYDSEDSSNASFTHATPAAPVASHAVAAAGGDIRSKKMIPLLPSSSQDATIATTNSSNASTHNIPVKSKNQEQQKRRGKKLLKLQSVLPQHIWNQLTTSSATTAVTSSSLGLADDDDDDDDEMDDPLVVGANLRKTNPSQKKLTLESQRPKNPSAQHGHSSSLLDLLNSLPTPSKQKQGTTKQATTGILPSSTTVPTATATNKAAGPVPSSHAQQTSTTHSGLGGAFLTSTVQVTRTKKGEQQIRSIHSPVDQNDNDEKPTAIDPSKSIHSTTHENYSHKSVPSHHKSDPQEPPSRVPPALQAVPRPSYLGLSDVYTSARSTTSRRSAAPPVRASAAPSMATYPTPFDQEEEVDTTHSLSQQNQQQQHSARAAAPLSNKARKKQMEAMLRAGNIDGIDSDIHLAGGGNANYAAQALLQQQQQQATAQYQAHGVRVVPTSQYNPATGQMDASASISGKQKGKNQLNALLANAASLEASRLENPQLSNNPRGTYRNNAKRKYGW